ncbi:MAG: ATP-binding cassette domain-containing protein [Eubacteriales bacterium]|nr:ATP-binding cassette domain-containing protein [Eubacteriales bacterium]
MSQLLYSAPAKAKGPELPQEDLSLASSETVLSVEKLRVKVSGEEILKDLELRLEAATIYGLLGPSGVGKSTLLMAIAGLLPEPPYSLEGSIAFRPGENLLKLKLRARQLLIAENIGLIFQEAMSSLDPYQSVGSALNEILAFKEKLPAAARKERIRELLELAGLRAEESLLRKYPHELSGGMAQRVTLALALIGQPRIILADEPSSSMDAIYALDFVQKLRELAKREGITVLFVSHDLALLANFCDRILLLDQGKIIEESPVSQMLSAPETELGREILKVAEKISRYEEPNYSQRNH